MKLRIARHTNNLEKIVHFYHGLLGLAILGDFKDHNNYNGIFLGHKNVDWHLEFTSSQEIADHHSDEDDLLVFYLESRKNHKQLIETLINNNITEVLPKNPYWIKNGNTFMDPDGFRIVLTVK